MHFDTVILGGGLAGMVAGISLQRAGKSTVIVSSGQNAMHFFSGTFESVEGAFPRMEELFSAAGVALHHEPGVRLCPLGTFRPGAMSLEDIDLFPSPKFAEKALIVHFRGYADFLSAFLMDGLASQGIRCRTANVHLSELASFGAGGGETHSVHLARIMDGMWEKVIRELQVLLRDEDALVLPQVFGLDSPDIPRRIREALPTHVVFAGTMPPSVPGIRTQKMLKRLYQRSGGIFLMGDKAMRAQWDGRRVLGVETRNMAPSLLEAEHFVLATGSFFSKGLRSTPSQVEEPIFHADTLFPAERSQWYDARFLGDQPYLRFGVRTDGQLRVCVGGQPCENLYACGSILGGTHPELGAAGGLAVRSAFQVVDNIL